MTKQTNSGPELDPKKWEYLCADIDPNWRWTRWLYYDVPLSGLCFYDGKPAFYMITDILSEEELKARNLSEQDCTYVLYKASEADFTKARESTERFQAAEDEFRKTNPFHHKEEIPPHSKACQQETDEDTERLMKNPVIGWVLL